MKMRNILYMILLVSTSHSWTVMSSTAWNKLFKETEIVVGDGENLAQAAKNIQELRKDAPRIGGPVYNKRIKQLSDSLEIQKSLAQGDLVQAQKILKMSGRGILPAVQEAVEQAQQASKKPRQPIRAPVKESVVLREPSFVSSKPVTRVEKEKKPIVRIEPEVAQPIEEPRYVPQPVQEPMPRPALPAREMIQQPPAEEVGLSEGEESEAIERLLEKTAEKGEESTELSPGLSEEDKEKQQKEQLLEEQKRQEEERAKVEAERKHKEAQELEKLSIMLSVKKKLFEQEYTKALTKVQDVKNFIAQQYYDKLNIEFVVSNMKKIRKEAVRQLKIAQEQLKAMQGSAQKLLSLIHYDYEHHAMIAGVNKKIVHMHDLVKEIEKLYTSSNQKFQEILNKQQQRLAQVPAAQERVPTEKASSMVPETALPVVVKSEPVKQVIPIIPATSVPSKEIGIGEERGKFKSPTVQELSPTVKKVKSPKEKQRVLSELKEFITELTTIKDKIEEKYLNLQNVTVTADINLEQLKKDYAVQMDVDRAKLIQEEAPRKASNDAESMKNLKTINELVRSIEAFNAKIIVLLLDYVKKKTDLAKAKQEEEAKKQTEEQRLQTAEEKRQQAEVEKQRQEQEEAKKQAEEITKSKTEKEQKLRVIGQNLQKIKGEFEQEKNKLQVAQTRGISAADMQQFQSTREKNETLLKDDVETQFEKARNVLKGTAWFGSFASISPDERNEFDAASKVRGEIHTLNDQNQKLLKTVKQIK